MSDPRFFRKYLEILSESTVSEVEDQGSEITAIADFFKKMALIVHDKSAQAQDVSMSKANRLLNDAQELDMIHDALKENDMEHAHFYYGLIKTQAVINMIEKNFQSQFPHVGSVSKYLTGSM